MNSLFNMPFIRFGESNVFICKPQNSEPFIIQHHNILYRYPHSERIYLLYQSKNGSNRDEIILYFRIAIITFFYGYALYILVNYPLPKTKER